MTADFIEYQQGEAYDQGSSSHDKHYMIRDHRAMTAELHNMRLEENRQGHDGGNEKTPA